jgi:hypothetical protein
VEVAIGRIIKCIKLNYGDIVGSKQNAENFGKSVQQPTKVVIL